MTWTTSPLTLAYQWQNLAQLIRQGQLGSSSNYSHQQIIDWCLAFARDFEAEPQVLHAKQVQALRHLADEMGVQWELHVATYYTLEQMARIDQNDLILPKALFNQWQQQLEAIVHE